MELTGSENMGMTKGKGKGKHGLTRLKQEEDGDTAPNRPGEGGVVGGEHIRGGSRDLFGRVVVGASPWNAAVVTPGDGNFERFDTFAPSEQLGPDSPQTMRRRQLKLLDRYMEVRDGCQ